MSNEQAKVLTGAELNVLRLVATQVAAGQVSADDFGALLIKHSPALIASARREQAMREALKKAHQFIVGGEDFNEDGSMIHDCEFRTNPLKGACDVCDMWADVRLALAASANETGEDGK